MSPQYGRATGGKAPDRRIPHLPTEAATSGAEKATHPATRRSLCRIVPIVGSFPFVPHQGLVKELLTWS